MTTSYQTKYIENITELPKILKEDLHQFNWPETEFVRFRYEIPSLDLLNWLKIQQNGMKFFWSSRDKKLSFTALGKCLSYKSDQGYSDSKLFENINRHIENTKLPLRWIGGGRFSSLTPSEPIWEKFGNVRFYLPRFEISFEDEKYYFNLNLYAPNDKSNIDSIIEECEQLDLKSDYQTLENQILQRFDLPDYKGWSDNINSALKSISEKRFEKIVLARRTDFSMINQPNPFDILSRLMKDSYHCYYFLFSLEDGSSFLGATPERLFSRDKDQIECEALAGTRARDNDPTLDQELADELLNSEKELHEQNLVSKSISDSLKDFVEDSSDPIKPKVDLLKLSKVQHLITRYKFKVKNGISTYDLVLALHPTAAVGGYPRQNVIDEIYKLEGFDRGWYASPIGWLSKDKAEFAVAIRSGLVHKNKLSLYSGAGIVEGSKPKSEWHEIENKISNFLKNI